MKIVFIGDIYGRSGREALARYLPKIQEQLDPDITIVNGENAAHGRGINEKICKGFFDLGVDCITTGNHIWDQREVIPYIQQTSRLIRPLNFPPGTPGKGICELRLNDGRIIKVVNVMGRIFMDPLDDPFRVMNEFLDNEELGKTASAIFVDFHGETTSEKMAFGHHFSGRISAMIGTHTHVPTADGRILPKGTAYISDVGMSGPYHSVLGRKVEPVIDSFLDGMKRRFPVAEEDVRLSGCLIGIDEKRGIAESFQRFELKKTPTLA